MDTSKYELIIFDADGTLRHVPGKPNKPPLVGDRWKLLPHVMEVMRGLDCQLAIASNQACVGRGEIAFSAAWMRLASLGDPLRIPPDHVMMCPHTPEDDCDCRKPKPGMLLDLMGERNPDRVLFVGDDLTDQQAAEAAGCDFCWASEFFGWGEQWPVSLKRKRFQLHPQSPQSLAMEDDRGQVQFVSAALVLEYIRALEDYIMSR